MACQDKFDVFAQMKFHQFSIPSQRLESGAGKLGIADTICATVPETFSCCPARTLVSRAPCNPELGKWRSGRQARLIVQRGRYPKKIMSGLRVVKFVVSQNEKANMERSFLAKYRTMKNGLLRPLEVDDQAGPERIVFRKPGGSDVRSHEITLNTPIQTPAANLIVHSSARHERGMGIVTKRGRLSKTEALPTNNHVNPRLKMVVVVHGDVGSPANEQRLRNYARTGPRVAKSRDGRAFQTKPVTEISGDVRLVGKIVKALAQDVEMQVLKPHTELPWFTVRRK
jgi:hypothetical protein